MRNMYYEIGSTFCHQNWNGNGWSIYQIRVVENEGSNGKQCDLRGEQKCKQMCCSKLSRKDGKNVIFKKQLKSITNG